jgi:hypothetical protein
MTDSRRSAEVVWLILSCEAYAAKADRQKQTWLRHVTDPYFHVIGRPNLPTPFEVDHEGHRLWVRAPDDYPSLPRKTIAALAAIDALFTYRFVFKTDDDQDVPRVEAWRKIVCGILRTRPVHYGGQLVTLPAPSCSDSYRLHPELGGPLALKAGRYCTGRFYLLSSLAVDSLLLRRAEMEAEVFEDYAVGQYLDPVCFSYLLPLQTSQWFSDAA